MLKEQKYWISTLETDIEEQINRSIRTTLSFRNVNKSEKARKSMGSNKVNSSLRNLESDTRV